MSLDITIHAAQTSILRELLFHPEAGYAVLQKPTSLTSDHFNFHIARLVDLGLVKKVSRGRYQLTPKGKEYANRLDTDNNTIERQPKVSVIIGLVREHNDVLEYLFQQRLKNPYYGFWGLFSGKVRWGETLAETAAREAKEETNLEADFTITGVYHELARSQETGETIDDKVFFMARGENVRGDLLSDFEGGHNEWRTVADVMREDKKYTTLEAEVSQLTARNWLHEQQIMYSNNEF